MDKFKIVKMKVPDFQWENRARYNLKRKSFYRVFNPSGEYIYDYSTKREALKHIRSKNKITPKTKKR